VKFDRSLTAGLTIGANYTWSGSFGNGDGLLGSDERPSDLSDYGRDWARTALDRTHRFVIHYMWTTPGKKVYGGCRIAGFSQWQSGRPFSIITGVDSNGDDNYPGDRPDYNPNGRLQVDPVTGDWRSFTTALAGDGAFITPLTAEGAPLANSMPGGGNLGRNTFRAPGFALSSVALMKLFRLGEHRSFEFRAECTNVFNHRNFGPPVATMNSPQFGRNMSDPPSRAVLMAVKIRF
jgi:hypothetical protein